MKVIEYVGEILSDGHLSLPDEIRKELDLNRQHKVKVVLTIDDSIAPDEKRGWKVFRNMGKDAIDGKLSDASINHGNYLYRNSQ